MHCSYQQSSTATFKIVSEYIISALLISALLVFRFRYNLFPRSRFRLLHWSIATTIASEFAFTLYADNYRLLNMLGHYLKIISFYLIYLSLVREGIRNPVQLFYSELQKTARDLRESNNTKNRIFSIIAHDLKNSFNSTIGITNLMLSNSQRHDMSSQENLELIAMINSSAKSTYELLENLLVTVDSNMIYTVLRNLLDNAIKYTWRGGTVTIRITANRSLARIEIEDSGIGMSSEEIKQGHL